MEDDRSLSAFTDNHGAWDIAQFMVPVAVIGVLALAGWAIWKGQTFNAAEVGGGIAAIIAALGAYKWGDSKSPRP
jgi:hypothetical protein